MQGEAGHEEHESHGEGERRQHEGEELGPRVGHLADDELAADVGEHRPRQVEHAARVLVQDVVGGEPGPDEEQRHGQQGGHQEEAENVGTDYLWISQVLIAFFVRKFEVKGCSDTV